MIFCKCLIVCRFPIRCAPSFRHTHIVYKLFRLSLISASYFGGHSVTHDFGHLDDVLTMVYSGSQLELSPEKKWHLSPSIIHIFKVGSQVAYSLGCENASFSQASFIWGANFSQFSPYTRCELVFNLWKENRSRWF
jgi:hypothetical protein